MQAAIAMRMLVNAQTSPLLSMNIWEGRFREMPSTTERTPDCVCCVARKFDFLSTNGRDFTTNLCGREAVQVTRDRVNIDLSATAQRWERLGQVGRTPWFVRCKLADPAGIDLTLFPDGRLIVRGTTEPMRAASIYARFVGS
jgi:adenylyltransferase/sulfurtransferase